MKKLLSLLLVLFAIAFTPFSVKADNADRAYEDGTRGLIVDLNLGSLDIPLRSFERTDMLGESTLKVYLKPGESWTITPPSIPGLQASSITRAELGEHDTLNMEEYNIPLPLTVHYDDLQDSFYMNDDGTIKINDIFIVNLATIDGQKVDTLPVIVREAGNTESAFNTMRYDYKILALRGQPLSFNNDYVPGKKVVGFKFHKFGTLSKEFNESVIWDPEAFDDPDAIVVYYGDPEESTFVNADGWTAWDLSTIPGNNEPEETTTEEVTEEETTVEATEVVETVVYEKRDNSAVTIITIVLVVLIAGGGGAAIYYAQKKNKK